MTARSGVVLDRLIRRSWLDAAADVASRERTDHEFRAELDRLLEGQLPGDPTHGALGKTKTVLSHIWSRVPTRAKPLRDEALLLLDGADQNRRLALHWGMGLATYPFFRDMATIVGRLLSLQRSVSRAQIRRRALEQFGERTTIQRAVPTLLASWREWSILVESEPGILCCQAILVADPAVQKWLIEAIFVARGDRSAQFDDLVKHPALFPFTLALLPNDLYHHPRLDVVRLGLDKSIVSLR